MKRADNIGKRVTQTLLLSLSAFLLLILLLLTIEESPVRDAYNAAAPDVQVTLHPGMPENWLLNAADTDTLDLLPGIGGVLAERIVQVRELDGHFFFPEDLISVKGIGEKTLSGILLWLDAHPEMQIILSADDADTEEE